MYTQVKVITRNKPEETLVLTFTNLDQAYEFYMTLFGRNDVLDYERPSDSIRTFDAKTATEALDSWAS